jgi:hypothetical protein
MTLDDIRKELQRDMVLDDAALDIESLKIPQLHSKYLNFLMDERLALRKLETDYRVLLRAKWEYYTGKMSQEELTARGWEPFALKILRNDLDLYLDSDADLIKLKQKSDFQKEKIALLEEVVKELNTRHWKIRNAIEWRRFTNGQ